MQISELSDHTEVSTKTIRYYEEMDLLPPPTRRPNGYRQYAEADVDRLNLVAGAHILAPAAGEVIQSATLAVKFGLTIEDLTDTLIPLLDPGRRSEVSRAIV